MTLSEILTALQNNPDDLSNLPNAIAKAQEMEKAEGGYLERIAKLQDINKSYLAQIPIPGAEPSKDIPEEDEEPTLDDAKNYLIDYMKEEK